ncbi:hypothetical protein DMR_10550 [Solidesulfovibrio magneticus RS-1]|uniref:Uncharacterized protein n=1 Tax=Solidesulfovibrio magneticus (strain ATCC 700980 / DSM 13731 / RS-1) TaxID=573370 RepID=C4XL07_SOLM1|nr:hypothetical protein DMR_10550 [Solidesulfovibrio magneticus RS-1]
MIANVTEPATHYSRTKYRKISVTMAVNGTEKIAKFFNQKPSKKSENQKLQLPAFQIARPFQDNSHQAGLKNRRILPLDTGDFAPKCHPAGHQLKIKSSSKLEFSTSCIASAITGEDSSSPSLGSFLGMGFSPGPPPPLSTGPVLRLFQSSAKLGFPLG